MEEYLQRVKSHGVGDVEHYEREPQPVYICANAYTGHAESFDREADGIRSEAPMPFEIIDDGQAVYLQMDAHGAIFDIVAPAVSTQTLPQARIVQQDFDTPEGTCLQLDRDMLGVQRGQTGRVGPLESLRPGMNRVRIWKRDPDGNIGIP